MYVMCDVGPVPDHDPQSYEGQKDEYNGAIFGLTVEEHEVLDSWNVHVVCAPPHRLLKMLLRNGAADHVVSSADVYLKMMSQWMMMRSHWIRYLMLTILVQYVVNDDGGQP